ncbi:Fur-regulated basic protein FbpB [Bacillus sonorensis]|uniref:RNA chaperone FbpB n=2 Tax=Bacillus sonorensis TaxID=119858 RepID=M5PCR3_9BACI|nr:MULTISPECIES: Fur-regulated basic protein FbpB [Bacillus]TWK75247.1 hypothetical protein CHCC20335_0979 [Bacillus paralicheniformis]ASB90958.1 hypothetical protein S101395_04470 [Bacillus sonorensis]EME74070.1 RNA chaperone FbpB [Bacillus sonorensis L12]MBG9913517.1 RNA chaperone FbpB [Bacillus sonorensis]MCF7619764.1 Fur-regulated basic protein FbpB [Bacillus sonorensis]
MSKRKIKTYHQLVDEYKKEIIRSHKEMDMIYDRIDRRLTAVSKGKQS